jgi:hypothetical protein
VMDDCDDDDDDDNDNDGEIILLGHLGEGP